MNFLTDEEIARLLPAETASFPAPVPTQIVSSDEYLPVPQTPRQREVEARPKELSDRLAKRQGLSRRRFFYGDLGQLFAWTAVAEPRLSAALMGILIKGLGSDHVLRGTEAICATAMSPMRH